MKKARSNRAIKAAQKEIRSAQALYTPEKKGVPKPGISPKELLKKYYPAKKQKSLEQGIEKFKLKVEKLKNKGSKRSKRTTPGELVGQNASPKVTQTEGKRWKKTGDLQNRIAAKKVLRKARQKTRK